MNEIIKFLNRSDKNRRIKGILNSTPVYQRSSFIENCWLWTNIKCLCDAGFKKIESLFLLKTIFAKKAPSEK